jgi:hypothetical protein
MSERKKRFARRRKVGQKKRRARWKQRNKRKLRKK